jgi:hypothetical protein
MIELPLESFLFHNSNQGRHLLEMPGSHTNDFLIALVLVTVLVFTRTVHLFFAAICECYKLFTQLYNIHR